MATETETKPEPEPELLPLGEETTLPLFKKKRSRRQKRRHRSPVAPKIDNEIEIENDAAVSDASSLSSSIDKLTAPLASLVAEYHRLL